MRRKYLRLYFTILLSSLILTHCPGGENGSSKEKLNAVTEPKKLKEGSKEMADDGSWVVIYDNKIYTKEYFEDLYSLFLKMSANTGMPQSKIADQTRMKQTILERILNGQMAYEKAIKDEFFQSQEGKNVIKAFYKQALLQYYQYKEVFEKIEIPGDKELEEFYKQYKSEFEKRGAKGLNAPGVKERVLLVYKNQKAQQEMAMSMNKLIMAKKIESNKKVMTDYLNDKITKDMAYKDEKDYWLIKVDGNALYLKEVNNLIDAQIEMISKSGSFKKGSQTPLLANNLLGFLKNMEVGYRAALEKGYHKEKEGKQFVELMQKRLISQYYLENHILKEIQAPTEKEVKPLLKDPKRLKMVEEFLKNNKAKITEKNKLEAGKQLLYNDRLQMAQMEFMNDLKEAHTIKISETYFKTPADKLREENQKKENK